MAPDYGICGSGWGHRLLLAVLAVLLTACAGPPPKRDDPLIGKIYQAQSQRQIEAAELYRHMEKSRVIYLGETHDNPRHHQLELEILDTLIKQGRRPALGFEFFSIGQTSYLMQFTQSRAAAAGGHGKPMTLAQLRRLLGWESREQAWSFYSPLLKLAKQYRLPVFGADLSAGLTGRITRVGVSGLSALESRQLYPSGFENDDYRQMMYQQFTEAHCGWSRPGLLKRLYQTWVARNDAMAMSIGEFLRERPAQPVMMILGSGHVANNMAVYERVAHQFPGIRQLNLGFRPVARTPRPLSDYLKPVIINSTRFAPDHEYFWFTQRVTYTDPCERFRKQLKKQPG